MKHAATIGWFGAWLAAAGAALGQNAMSESLPSTQATEWVGEWSEPMRELQARLVIKGPAASAQGGEMIGPGRMLAYLELRNLSSPQGTRVLKFDFNLLSNLTCTVTDAQDREVPRQPPLFRSSFIPEPYPIALPPDSHLRFPVSLNGGGVSQDRVLLDLGSGSWTFDRRESGPYHLGGTLKISRDPARYQRQWWHGELVIPKVPLPLP